MKSFFNLSTLALLGLSAWVAANCAAPPPHWPKIVLLMAALAVVYLCFLPVWMRDEAAQQTKVAPVTSPPAPVAAPRVEAKEKNHDQELAEIAVLAWKIHKRAEKEPNPPKPILRNSTRIIELLGQFKVEILSYEGRKINMGSRVEVQEAVEGVEEHKVIAEHEPEIQVGGKLVLKALLTVGKGLSDVNSETNKPA